jgi:hypothetical protein
MQNYKYDLIVAYRIYPKVSKIPPIYSKNKYKLSELCLRSFKKSLGKLKVKLYVLLDNCPDEYSLLFKKYFKSKDLELINLAGIGNQNTFKMQIDILSEQNDSEFVYFAEDDYFYFPDTFSKMIEFMKNNKDVDFISPYNHLDYYNLDIHKYKSEIRFFEGTHWRTASTTCLTFLIRKSVLMKTKRSFLSFTKKNHDSGLWMGLTKYKIYNIFLLFKYLFTDRALFRVMFRGLIYGWRQLFFMKRRKLWIPIPSFSTHMENKFLAPGFDWDKILKQEAKSVR